MYYQLQRWTTALLILLYCGSTVECCGWGWGRRCKPKPPPPPPPPRVAPRFENCPGRITVSANYGQVTTVVNWPRPKARSRNNNKFVNVYQTSGPSSGRVFREGSPVRISYTAKEDTKTPISTCTFLVTVTVPRCPNLPHQQFGGRSCSKGDSTIHGSQCSHWCQDGYELSGSKTITCQTHRRWDNNPPLCQPISCGEPTPPEAGGMVCFRGYTYPEMCALECYNGYSPSGSTMQWCQVDGSWTNVDPCVDLQAPSFPNGCPNNKQVFSGPLEAPTNLTFDLPITEDNSGEDVTLLTDPPQGSLLGPGYHSVRITAKDSSDNNASCNFLVTVQVRYCTMLTAPLNGQVTCTRGYVEGSECMVSCNHGYLLQGESLLTCLVTEQWDSITPTCNVVTCPPVPSVDDGYFHCPTGIPEYRTTCSLMCDEGFQLSGTGSIECQIDGNWTTPSVCLDVQSPSFPEGCPPSIDLTAARLGEPTSATWESPPVLDNSGLDVMLQSDTAPGSNFTVGVTTVTYTAIDVTGNEATCSMTVTVYTDVCEVPSLGEFMLYDCPDGYVYGATCTLNCTRGYPLDGPSTITCERDEGTFPVTMAWSSSAECTVSACPDLDPPDNGALACHEATFGRDCLMNCQQGFDVPAVMSNDGHLYCTNSNQFWVPSSAPDCVAQLRPNAIRLHSDLFYYADSCESSSETIRSNFITRMTESAVLSDACVNVPSCTVDNVQVSCGAMTGRKRRSVDEGASLPASDSTLLEAHSGFHDLPASEGSRVKRSAASTHYVLVQFAVLVELGDNATVQEYQQESESLKSSLADGLTTQIANGAFDLEGLTVDSQPGTFYTTTSCPNGTKNTYGTSTACVGCSKGHFMNPADQCEECPVGSYTGLQEATACTLCPQGWTTLTTGSVSNLDCKETCSPGTRSPDGFTPCQPCKAGDYSSRQGTTTCDPCPVNTWTLGAGSNSSQQCVPADIQLGARDAEGEVKGWWSSLTMSAWIHLSNHTTLTFSLLSAGEQATLASYTVTSGGNDYLPDEESFPSASRELPPFTWSRVVIVLATDDVNVTQVADDVVVLPVGQGPFNGASFSCSSNDSSQQVLLSGWHVTDGVTVEEETTNMSHTSCMGNASDNLLNLSQNYTSFVTPSSCHTIDHCASEPCGSHGQCLDGAGGYQCQCLQGWRGSDCQLPPDTCYLCQNGAQCQLLDEAYLCVCEGNFTGDTCQHRIVDGGWGEWPPWPECSATCGGQQQRQRLCNNPAPQHGGSNCTGEVTQTQNCGPETCVVIGSWTPWSGWSTCSATCNGGERTRERNCSAADDTPNSEVVECLGQSQETEICNSSAVPCPIDGGWSNYSSWSPCSSTCGQNGTQSRERSCDNPVPSYGGKDCDGNATEVQECDPGPCPECDLLPEPVGGEWECSIYRTPYLITCNITCLPGFVSPDNPVPYLCGVVTGFQWPQYSNASQELACLRPLPLDKGSFTVSLELESESGSGCDDGIGSSVSSQVEANMADNVACVRLGLCQLEVKSTCLNPSKRRRRKRSVSAVKVTTTISLNLKSADSLHYNDSERWSEYQNMTSLAEQSLEAEYDPDKLYGVSVEGMSFLPNMDTAQSSLEIICPQGTIYVERVCVPCSAGSMEESGQCVLCPLGQYQDVTGATSCKHCPPGKAWDLPGASDPSLCLYDWEAETSDVSTSMPTKSPEFESQLIMVISVTSGLVLVAAAIILVVGCAKTKRTKAKVQKRKPSKVAPCDATFDTTDTSKPRSASALFSDQATRS